MSEFSLSMLLTVMGLLVLHGFADGLVDVKLQKFHL